MALAANALTTVQNVKDALGLTDTSMDAWIERKVNSVSSWVENYCRRKFKRQTYTDEPYVGTNKPELLLKNYPVVGTPTVIHNDVAVTDFTVDAESGILTYLQGWAATGKGQGLANRLTDPVPNIKATYTAGYILPKDETEGPPALVRDLPYDLEEAVIGLIVIEYRQRGSEHVASEKIGPVNFTYLADMPKSIRDSLNHHRRMVI